MKEMVSLELMEDLRFLLVGISTFFQMLGFLIPYVYLIDMANNTKWGQQEDTSFLVSIIGKFISNLCLVHVIWTKRRMTSLVLNVCFDFFSRHKNHI